MERCVLVVDDNPDMLTLTRNAWARNGYVQRCTKTGEEAAEALITARKADMDYRLVALVADYLDERLLPMVKLVRHISDLPLLILTSEFHTQTSMETFVLGADRYMPIPATIDEGIINGLALIRMSERYMRTDQANQVIMLPNHLYINNETRCVFLKDHPIHLARREFDLLWFFALNRNITLRYEKIYEQVWGEEHYEGANRTIWTTVKHLRDKLGILSETADLIRSERYVGYRFDI